MAHLEFFVKNASGEEIRSKGDMAYIQSTLRRALKLGPPAVLCLHLTSPVKRGRLASFAAQLTRAHLTIKYGTVRTDPIQRLTSYVFWVNATDGSDPKPEDAKVASCLRALGEGGARTIHSREDGGYSQQQPARTHKGAADCMHDQGTAVVTLWKTLWSGG